MLVILGGLPGTGKSTIGQALAKKLSAVYLRIDSIEQAIRNNWSRHGEKHQEMGPDGYHIAYAIAADNLRLGQTVIADSVNPIAITRDAWREVATELNVPYVEIECICSDKNSHKKRVENRIVSIHGFKKPTWQDVVNREYEPWPEANLIIDTAKQTEQQAVATIIDGIGL